MGTVGGLSPGTAGVQRASLSSGGAAQTTGGIRLPEGPLSSPARRTELGDRPTEASWLPSPVPYGCSLLGLGRYPPDQTRGRGLQDAGNLKGPDLQARDIRWASAFWDPGAPYD